MVFPIQQAAPMGLQFSEQELLWPTNPQVTQTANITSSIRFPDPQSPEVAMTSSF